MKNLEKTDIIIPLDIKNKQSDKHMDKSVMASVIGPKES